MSFLESHSGLDLAQQELSYPVVESAALSPLPRRLFRQARRRMQELPELVGGSILVFQSNERFALAPADVKMLSSDVVVKATMVAVVLTKKQLVPTVAMLPSINPRRKVAVCASYSCQVVDAVRVLEEGCWDVRADLLAYLLNDPKVQMLGAREDVADNPEVQQKILARTLARSALEPPNIPGMKVQLVDVSLGIHSDEHENHGSLPGGDGAYGYGDDRFRDGFDSGSRDSDDSYPPDGD